MERIVFVRPAWDRRDPDPNKNYGIHCAEIVFILKGDAGAIQFVLSTGWYLPELKVKPLLEKPYPSDLGYHSPVPRYEGQEPMTDSCEWLNGKPCYYDGSVLNAQPVFDVLLREGSDGVWRELEEYYAGIFGAKEAVNA